MKKILTIFTYVVCFVVTIVFFLIGLWWAITGPIDGSV